MSTFLKNGKRSLALLAGVALASGGAFAGATTASAEEAQSGCEKGNLCLWGEPGFPGEPDEVLYDCGFFDIGDAGLAPLGSYDNNQFDGTVTTFYTWVGDENPDEPWAPVHDSTAPDSNDNVEELDIHGVQVC